MTQMLGTKYVTSWKGGVTLLQLKRKILEVLT